MDVTFKTDEGRFNYRACAVIVDERRLLVMRDEQCPYYYLPGGKVKLHETAEEATVRELREEMRTGITVIRPLWMCESFFTEDVDGERFHELCLYFPASAPDAPRSETFTVRERGMRNIFRWLPFEQLKDAYLYPPFIKTAIFHLPDHLQLIHEVQ